MMGEPLWPDILANAPKKPPIYKQEVLPKPSVVDDAICRMLQVPSCLLIDSLKNAHVGTSADLA